MLVHAWLFEALDLFVSMNIGEAQDNDAEPIGLPISLPDIHRLPVAATVNR